MAKTLSINSINDALKNNTLKTTFKFERETKGAVVFQETNADGDVIDAAAGATVGTLYIRKSKLPNGIPQTLAVTIVLDV